MKVLQSASARFDNVTMGKKHVVNLIVGADGKATATGQDEGGLKPGRVATANRWQLQNYLLQCLGWHIGSLCWWMKSARLPASSNLSGGLQVPLIPIRFQPKVTRSDRTLFRLAIRFYLERLGVSDFPFKHIALALVPASDAKRRQAHGWCEPSSLAPRSAFSISMEDGLPLNHQVTILAHECVHVRQFATGRLSTVSDEDGDRCPRWNLRVYPPWYILKISDEYDETPWEREAHGEMLALANAFVDYAIERGLLTEDQDATDR